MFTINKASFSGQVKEVIGNPNGSSLVKVENIAFGLHPTLYNLYLPKEVPCPSNGDCIAVRNAFCYVKNGERRFKITNPDQITKGDFNDHSFTGIVKGFHQVGDTKHITIEISQDVLGKLPTSFLLFLSEKQQREVRSPFMEPGDYVIVTSAKAYEKDGEWRYKAELSDIGVLYFHNYDKGSIDAQMLKEQKGE